MSEIILSNGRLICLGDIIKIQYLFKGIVLSYKFILYNNSDASVVEELIQRYDIPAEHVEVLGNILNCNRWNGIEHLCPAFKCDKIRNERGKQIYICCCECKEKDVCLDFCNIQNDNWDKRKKLK